MKKVKLLLNLPPGFFRMESMKEVFSRFEKMACEVRRSSHNTAQDIAEDVKWAEAIIMWGWPDLDDKMLSANPNLKFVGHINDSRTMAEAELRHGITISELRHGWSPAVAEMALTLTLSLMRRTSRYHLQMREGAERWINDFPYDIDPLERSLTGRKVGIVGFGRIAQGLADLLVPFKVKLCAYDPYLPKAVADRYGAKLVEMPELMKESEVIVLCAANTKESKHLVNRQLIESIRPGAVLVNVGRASLIDMDALVARLKKGDIQAALDVFDREPLEADSELRKLPNAYLTPHRAGGILESVDRILAALADDLEHHLKGEPLKYQITEKDLNCLA